MENNYCLILNSTILCGHETQLESMINSTDVDQLKRAIKQVEDVSEEYVGRRMNKSVTQVLKGQKIDEVEVN